MKKKRILLSIGAAATIGLAVSACSGQPPADMSTLTFMAPYLVTNSPPADNVVEEHLEEIVDSKIDITWVPGASYEDKTNITLAGDDVPHVMVIQSKSASFVRNAEAGAFWDLTEYLEDYPNLTSAYPEVENASSVNGKIYGVYRVRDLMRSTAIFRADWLAKLGLETPTTTDELFEVARAFTEQDPDGNGIDDTYGLTLPKWPGSIGTNSPYDIIETWFGAGNRWTERGSELVPSFTTDEWIDALDFVKSLYEAGYTNPDIATFDAARYKEPFLTGRGGIYVDTHSLGFELVGLLKSQDPENFEDYVAFSGNLVGPAGELLAHPSAGYAGFLAVPKSKVRTEEQLRQVLEVLDRMNSEEGRLLLFRGVEGVTYTMDGDLLLPTADASQQEKDISLTYQQLIGGVTSPSGYQGPPAQLASEYEQQYWDEFQTKASADLEHAVFDPAAGYVSPTYLEKGAQLDTIISDARIQYIAGQIDRSALEGEIERWRSAGGDAVIAEINELAK